MSDNTHRELCHLCDGSGLGMSDRTRCQKCGGSGELLTDDERDEQQSRREDEAESKLEE